MTDPSDETGAFDVSALPSEPPIEPPSDDQLEEFFLGEESPAVENGQMPMGSGPQPQMSGQVVAAQPPRRPTWRDKRAAGRLHARKVRRLVRHIEPWSVLKIGLVFYFVLWGVMLVASLLLWSAAVSSGTIDNIEQFIEKLFALETFEFDADQIFRSYALAGLVMVVAATGFTVLLAVMFNLISDLMGGLRITVVEEETARPRRRKAAQRTMAAPPDVYPQQPGAVSGPMPVAGQPSVVGQPPVAAQPSGPAEAVPIVQPPPVAAPSPLVAEQVGEDRS